MKRSKKLVSVVAILLLGTCGITEGSLLRNVTSSVFGEDLPGGILPLAFGDFNSDKLTDLLVMTGTSTLSILLAKPQTFAMESGTYFNMETRTKGLECTLNNYDIIGLSPSDFDGDGGMDILVLAKSLDNSDPDPVTGEDTFEAFVLWGDHDQSKDTHKILCPEKSLKQQWHHELQMSSEPLILDANGDDVADLFGSQVGVDGSKRSLWLFGKDRTQGPEVVDLTEDQPSSSSSLVAGVIPEPYERFRRPHSNAFVDLNTDGNADLFVTAKDRFELWENVGGSSGSENKHFKKHKEIRYPECKEGDKGACIGQSVFADFDLDGKLDMIFPVCENPTCETSTLYFATMESLWSGQLTDFLSIPAIMGDFIFDNESDPADTTNPYLGLTPRVGDINLDGYPDLLIRVRNKVTKKIQIHLLLNIEDTSSSPTTNQRGFLLQSNVMEGINATVMATFYDLYENGIQDVILVHRDEHQVGSGSTLKIGAFTNFTQDSDAYFVKVIVLSGVCFHNCEGNHIDVPYGTNLPGQTVCYRTQRQVGEEFRTVSSCAPQLTQTAHHALQLPYNIFGLGMSPNFLDYMTVNVTNASSTSHGKSWPQIIPNSQLYVIPHPANSPWRWEAKLFITPSRSITLTGISLVGTCFLCVVIIVILHWKERRKDRQEKLAEANRFHFDAM